MSTDFQKSLKRIGGVALASVLLASCSQDWSSSDQFKFSDNQNNPYAAGKARMAAGHYGLAVESFRKVLAKEPLSIKALNGLAATYDLLGRFDLAERYYRQALNLDPKSVQSLNNLGYSYYLRGEYGRARGLFERAARIDGGNSVVVGNLASLDQAEMQQQVAAAAKQASKATGGKDETAPSQTPWIERSDRQVQTLVTKPDSAIVKAARDYRVEPRIVHAPKPLIEIATVAPVKIDAMKPPSAPAVAAVDSKPAILKVEPKAPRTKLVIGTEPVEVGATARIVEISIRVGSARVGPDVAASVPASTPETGSTKSIEPESYALIESPAETLPVKPGIAGSGLADLPKLNEDVARDVHAASAKTEAAAPARSEPPVPSPAMAKTPDQVDRPVKTAALAVDIEAAAPARSEPPVPAPAPETGSTKSIESESYASIGSPADTRPVKPGIADSGLADLPKLNEDVARDVRAALAKIEAAAWAKSAAPLATPKDPSPAMVKTPDQVDRPVKIAALAVDIEAAAPARSEPPVPAPAPETGSTKTIESESYASIGSSADTRPVKPGIADSGLADLPKLNEDVARDVRAALAKAEAAAWAKSAAPLAAPKDPSPTMAKTPDQVDRPVKIAALAADIEPTRTDPGRGLGKGKLTSKDAADQFAALKKAVRLEISNGAGRLHMAARMRRYLVGHGMSNSRLTNAKSFNNQVSVLYFKPGHMANAKSLRGVLPVPPDLRRNAVLGSDLRLVLGGDLLSFDRGLISKFK
ncbi:MAG: tetratricopeptide repeat protein [Alphaproteobacteria bacterium]|nr:tetratricopeptide repeat protein [Alphaproteobacteria bacterium]